MLHARNWHSQHHRYIAIYPQVICLPKNNHRRLYPTIIRYIIAILKDPPKTLPFFSYGNATKNAINHITHILKRSAARPGIQMSLLPQMLPQSQNENLQPPEITSISPPDPRVEPVSKSPRVKTQESAPTPPPRDQSYTSPSLDHVR